MEPTILYEDKNILAINKPAGLIIHSNGLPAQAGKTKEATLVDWLLLKYPQISINASYLLSKSRLVGSNVSSQFMAVY